jgi:hypothetical protein
MKLFNLGFHKAGWDVHNNFSQCFRKTLAYPMTASGRNQAL